MIDMHMHTTHSDGTDSTVEILKNCNKANLEVISITDHNSVMAYYDLENIDIKKYYQGKIITGCEFTINYNNNMIEVLGYGFDYKKINNYLKENCSPKQINKNSKIMYKRLVSKIKELNLKFNEENIKITEDEFSKGIFGWQVWDELRKYNENIKKINEDIWESYAKFFRNSLTNSKSILFVNYLEFRPSLNEIIDLIHENGGLAFLAHPFQYKYDETKELLNEIVNNYNIDGIECYHTTFDKEKMIFLENYAKKHNLLISGGSDYHGKNKINHNLGIGNNNLNINAKILENRRINSLFY